MPAFSTSRSFDSNTKPPEIYGQYDVEWEQRKISVDFTSFQSLPVQFGFDKIKKLFYLKIDKKKYSL